MDTNADNYVEFATVNNGCYYSYLITGNINGLGGLQPIFFLGKFLGPGSGQVSKERFFLYGGAYGDWNQVITQINTADLLDAQIALIVAPSTIYSELGSIVIFCLLLFNLLLSSSYSKDYYTGNTLSEKFEISKKIFNSYDISLKENTKSYKTFRNYILLSVICIKKYEKTNNLKFLNTLLKVNDIVCSVFVQINDENNLSMIKYILEKEL